MATQTNESRPARGGSREAIHRRASDGDWIARNPRPLQAPRYEPSYRRQIEEIHRQGPVVLGYLVEALAAGADLRETVAEYAALDGDFIASYGADRFPAAVHVVGGASP